MPPAIMDICTIAAACPSVPPASWTIMTGKIKATAIINMCSKPRTTVS